MEAMGNRKGILKSILKQLHQGARVEDVKDQAQEVMKELTAEEIAEVEQELIEDGISRETIHKLCDIHIAVFKESLDKQALDLERWHPLFILMQEHKTLLPIVEKLKETEDPETIRHIIHHLMESEKHYLREENVLFPYIEKHGITEPPAVMWSEHDKIRDMEKQLYNLFEQSKHSEMRELASTLYDYLSSHFYKENNILYPAAYKVISEDEFLEIRQQFDEIGYCCYMPEMSQPKEKKIRKETDQQQENMIQFETGNFTQEELQVMLDALPIDITFVGKDDTVRYFSQSPERVFVRTKAIIGRTVQNCHPAKSMDIVNKIVTAFKNGTKDKAEFWLELNERLIYIRYFPLRKNGEYLGTIEVTQDITDIKKIEGQRQLLDWE